MQTRYRAAATALLLTATAGMAATGGAAEASGTHHSDAKAKTLTITVKSKDGKVKLSDDKVRPGNTVFKVKNMDGKKSRGLIQVFRLRSGYELSDAFADFPQLFVDPPTDESIAAVNRVDDNIVFYGGIEAMKKQKNVTMWAVNLDKAGTYYVANLDKNTLTTLEVAGDRQKRALPHQDGFIDPVKSNNPSGNDFKAGKHNAARGWMSTTNKAKEPHFVDVEQVKKGTTDKDLNKFFNGQAPPPFVNGGAATDTGVISPGHRFLWAYHLKSARFAALCFWPGKADGMPHALMGMHAVFKLH